MKKKLQILKGLGLFKISLSTNPIIEMSEWLKGSLLIWYFFANDQKEEIKGGLFWISDAAAGIFVMKSFSSHSIVVLSAQLRTKNSVIILSVFNITIRWSKWHSSQRQTDNRIIGEPF